MQEAGGFVCAEVCRHKKYLVESWDRLPLIVPNLWTRNEELIQLRFMSLACYKNAYSVLQVLALA